MPLACQVLAVIEVPLFVALLKVAPQIYRIISQLQTSQKAKTLEDIARKVSRKVANPNKSPT